MKVQLLPWNFSPFVINSKTILATSCLISRDHNIISKDIGEKDFFDNFSTKSETVLQFVNSKRGFKTSSRSTGRGVAGADSIANKEKKDRNDVFN
jgi:hypothetical protein